MKRGVPFLIIVGVLIAALLAAWYLRRSPVDTRREAPPTPAVSKGPTGPVQLGANPPQALGNTEAPVMLEEFGDFECSPCGLLHPVLKTMKAEFGARLVILFREYPMTSLHPHAMAAARAAEAAGMQGRFWEMHDLLYENQKIWHESSNVEPVFEQYAAKVGLSMEQFKRDMNSEGVDQRILLDGQRGRWVGVTGTPTIFLNGREVPLEALTPDKLRALINAQH